MYKVYYYMPKWTTDEDACDSIICSCRDHHTRLPAPRVTNIGRDPRETTAVIPAGSALYARIVDTVARAVLQHEATLSAVPNQMARTWLPWLQPCCAPPTCLCANDAENALYYRPPWERE